MPRDVQASSRIPASPLQFSQLENPAFLTTASFHGRRRQGLHRSEALFDIENFSEANRKQGNARGHRRIISIGGRSNAGNDSMPQLNSGRHVALGEPGLIEAVGQDNKNGAFAAAVIARTSIRKDRDLIEVLPVIHFDQSKGTPPDSPQYPSDYLVFEVLEGKSDWSENEVSEFRAWIENDAGLREWITDHRRRLDEAIRASPHWQLEELEELGL
jgi:hypothetical protein